MSRSLRFWRARSVCSRTWLNAPLVIGLGTVMKTPSSGGPSARAGENAERARADSASAAYAQRRPYARAMSAAIIRVLPDVNGRRDAAGHSAGRPLGII